MAISLTRRKSGNWVGAAQSAVIGGVIPSWLGREKGGPDAGSLFLGTLLFGGDFSYAALGHTTLSMLVGCTIVRPFIERRYLVVHLLGERRFCHVARLLRVLDRTFNRCV